MGRKKKTRILKLEYQRVIGKQISIRTWQRVLSRLGISDADTQCVDLVRSYAIMRRISPHSKLSSKDAENFVFLSKHIPRLTCNGQELLEALQRLKPQPSIPTIYRWGKEIGIGFSVNRIYLPSELELWLEKILSKNRYSV